MRIIECQQYSPEWFTERCGIPTSSNFDRILDNEGNPSKQRKRYLYQVAGERITKKAEDTYVNAAMIRGLELEAEARSFYELVTGRIVTQVGLCLSDELPVGSSPDGLVSHDGVLEIKCPLIHTQVGYLLDGKLPEDYFPQVQGQLFVTGRKWCDFLSYYPSMRPLLVRVEADPAFQEALKRELGQFCTDLDKVVDKIK